MEGWQGCVVEGNNREDGGSYLVINLGLSIELRPSRVKLSHVSHSLTWNWFAVYLALSKLQKCNNYQSFYSNCR